MAASKNETFGLIKTLVDAHTMGIHAAAALLRDCGYRVLISPKNIEYAMERISAESAQKPGAGNASKPVLMIMGGSQGALSVNEAVRRHLDELLPDFNIVHLCGAG